MDTLMVGHQLRAARKRTGMTLGQVAERFGGSISQLSTIESGKRELRLSELHRLADILGVAPDALLSADAPSERIALEVALEQAQAGPLYGSLGLPRIAARATMSDDVLRALLGLHEALREMHEQRAATPEEARRANAALREEMKSLDNHYEDLERIAAELLDAVGHHDGPLSRSAAADLAAHVGLSIHYVPDLPGSTRSIIDRAHGRMYLPVDEAVGRDPRVAMLQALAGHVLGLDAPATYADFLRQRVATNYLAGALLIREDSAVAFLADAKERRELAVEDLRDAFATSYESAGHRFTNLVTHHFGIPVHFVKVHASGAISKAYENDGVMFPQDVLGAVEGQTVCRNWSARRVFDAEDRFGAYHQYTDKPNGTYWCSSRIQQTSQGLFSVSVGTPFAHTKWFRGRSTPHRLTSTCPDPACCREPSAELQSRWGEAALPTPKISSSLLAALPAGSFAGADRREVLEFLDSHASD
ncbi:helix-turn-helix domain-containing protein [Galbitalea sp. SE-J8]|uniref:XRE family transcriptional regulator n=1 Tax=Galbitalea sp. SE-J8 TaxID=3054952 RepID=UPI00259D08DF|nr:XRE family transcriptional regulator [Galbitalea sp. SE-J8]MDM4762428.1 helix-turn-helix domain-containing protein [Galbitalea sp. SE-J8]